MREPLVVIGLVALAIGLRSSRVAWSRKLGAIGFLGAGYAGCYFLTGNGWLGLLGVVPWFLLPWIELLTRIRQMRLPRENRLTHRQRPDPSFFPNASEAAVGMEEAGFEHVDDGGWEWGGMEQYFQIFWNPEERAEACVCLCEQGDVAFAFMLVTTRHEDGRVLRTTNFPFSPTLKPAPHVHWNHVPCERNCFHDVLADHHQYLDRIGVSREALRVPDPEAIEACIEAEMKEQIEHNLAVGIIRPAAGGNHFQYSIRGLFFLWGQFVKDMIRLC